MMDNIFISKHNFLMALRCGTMGWHGLHNTVVQDASLSEIMRSEQGQSIHEYARSQYTNGVLVEEVNAQNALKLTAKLMNDPNCEVVFEPYFRYGRCVARADVLIRRHDGWVIEEVKSSINIKRSLIEDLAYTIMVMKGFGIGIEAAILRLVNPEYCVGDDVEPLLKPIDVTEEVWSIAHEFEEIRHAIEQDILSDDCPAGEWKYACRKCDYFAQHCVGRGVEAAIFQIPRLGERKFNKLLELGVTEIEAVPEDFDLSDRQYSVVEVVKAGEMQMKPGLMDTLGKWHQPWHYLDFETVSSCMPMYAGLQPYTQIPTQYSLHIMDSGGDLKHLEYLAEGTYDCRREFVEKLLADLEPKGSIVVYSHFEKTILTRIQNWFDDLESDIERVKSRLVDMEKLISKFVQHPGFKGRTSIKVVLPVLVPEMDYSELEISSGDDALVMFYRIAMGQVHPDRVDSTRLALLEYCKLDTLAMVRIHEVLLRLAYGNSEKLS